jgi:hypothetical protein
MEKKKDKKGLMDILFKKAGRPNKVGKPNFKGGIAENVKRIANMKRKKKKSGY